LAAGSYLTVGKQLVSLNRLVFLSVLANGNVVATCSDTTMVWQTSTAGMGTPSNLDMQADGNVRAWLDVRFNYHIRYYSPHSNI
jgi:hypothetical protein